MRASNFGTPFIANLVISLVLLSLPIQSKAQTQNTEHTYKLDAGEAPGKGKLEDVSWLVGSWQGTAFGKRFEEVWNPATNGSMVGMFKLLNEDGVEFYELLLLKEEQDSLSLKVKHFDENFHAWETKKDYVNFRLVKIEPNAIHFSGISFYRDSDDKIRGYIVLKDGKGNIREEPLNYHRVAQ